MYLDKYYLIKRINHLFVTHKGNTVLPWRNVFTRDVLIHLNILTRRQMMSIRFKNAEVVEEAAFGTLSTLAVFAVPILIILASA